MGQGIGSLQYSRENGIEPFVLTAWWVDSQIVLVGYWNEEEGKDEVHDVEHCKEEDRNNYSIVEGKIERVP